jgi:hypothetical protein
MLDFFNFYNQSNNCGGDIKFYYGSTQTMANSSGIAQEWTTWIKPRGAKLVYFHGAGSGGSGAGAYNGGSDCGGGGGGSSGNEVSLCIPACFLPDILYVQTGMGPPANTASNANGINGNPTLVCIEPSTLFNPMTTVFCANGGTGGVAPVGITGGLGGAAPTNSTIANMLIGSKGIFTLAAGLAGTSGGAGNASGVGTAGVGNNVLSVLNGLHVGMGCGGGGSGTTAGGAGGTYPTQTTWIDTGGIFYGYFTGYCLGGNLTTHSLTGLAGYSEKNSAAYLGGMGGGGGCSSNASNRDGSNGGAGFLGSGGGGAGGCLLSASAFGGAGGDGYLYIITSQ